MQDRQTIETLFRRHYGRMLLTARTLLRDPEEARDVVSDVFAELAESSLKLDMERVESLLLVSVRNKCHAQQLSAGEHSAEGRQHHLR